MSWLSKLGLDYLTKRWNEAVARRRVERARRIANYIAFLNSQNNEGQTPLFVAAENGFLEGAKILLERGAYVNLPDHDGRTPLDVASTEPMRNLLMQHGGKSGRDIFG